MKKLSLILSLLILLPLRPSAQEYVDRLYFDMRAAFHQEMCNGQYSSQMLGEHLNFNMMGRLTPKIDYRIRQRLNKKVFDERNMFNATDFMYVNWHATDRWSFLAGKYAVLIGGYEYDANPIDVYYYSQFCNNIYQCFTFGAVADYRFAEDQHMVFQFCNSPLSLGFQNVYALNMAWNGQFAPWWKTLWSVNFVEDMDKKMVNYIALGNHFIFGNVIFDIDIMNRAGFTQKRFLMSDYSLISKIIWSVGKWNICAKAGYETNALDNVAADGRAYDLVIAPGTEYLYAGCGLEWFPLGSDRLRFHGVYYWDNAEHRHNYRIGVTWRVDVIGK
jgi:hypothetical protein